MANVTVSVPDELKERMDKLDTVNWSAVARTAFEQHAKSLEFIKEYTKDSTMTEEDAIELGRIVNKSMQEKFRKKIKAQREALKKQQALTGKHAPRR